MINVLWLPRHGPQPEQLEQKCVFPQLWRLEVPHRSLAGSVSGVDSPRGQQTAASSLYPRVVGGALQPLPLMSGPWLYWLMFHP